MRAIGEIVVTLHLDQFVRQIVDSTLMSADVVAALIDSLPADKKPQDGEQLAKELVRLKKLTAYQAQQIYAGKGRTLVLGNYVILDKLGQGGMGLVLKAEHRRMKRLVALKVLSPKVTKSPEALRRFQREVEAAARLTHPNIVIAHDADEAGGTHFFVMEYVDGTDLSSLVKKSGRLPVDQALDCILQAARGLEFAHANGVVHRDIKPANLLLDRRGTVKILDMGLARLDTAGAQQDQLTGTGQIMGTVDYMAPEQAMDTKHADARADIYSLGVTLWYLLTGRPLYAGETTVEKLMAHQTKPIPSLCDACPEVTPPLDAIFHRMVAKTPQDRYQTMAEVIAELEQCRSGSMAGPPVVSIATAEDARLDEFLRGMAAPSKQRAVPRQKASRAVATAVAPEPARTADLDATLDLAAPQVATDPKTEESLPGGRLVPPSAEKVRRPPRPPWWLDRRKLAAAGAGGLLVILLGIWVVVRDKEGKEVARVPMPEGGSVALETAAKTEASTERKSGDKAPQSKTSPAPLPPWTLPADAPAPAIAPFDAARAKEHQAAWANYLGVEVESENSLGMKFVLIPPGEFDMGSTEAEVAKLLEEAKATNQSSWYIDRLPSEAPKHRVRITKPFYLATSEVTQAQYERVVGNNPSKFKEDANCPVEMVSWDDASAFCRKLGELPEEESAQRAYRLPTEGEWEYACRCGTTTTWYSGDEAAGLKEIAWYGANAGGKTHPVCEKTPNAWGLYDMHGNVWEWCQEWFGEWYYATSPLDDPTGPTGGSARVDRGGCWSHDASGCRASRRGRRDPGYRLEDRGFRLARAVSWPASGAASPQKKVASSPPSTPPAAPKPAPPWTLPPGAPPPAIAPFDAAKAKEHQVAWAKYLGVEVESENSIGIRFALIPPGEFDMGSTEAEVAKLLEEAKATNQSSWYIDRLFSEAPKHRVRITKPFYLGDQRGDAGAVRACDGR